MTIADILPFLMRVMLTGGTGFIGGQVARRLRDRGDQVCALVRSAAKGKELEALGCDLVIGDLADKDAIAKALEGCDAAIHGAAVYEVGIPASEHRAMYESNVLGTEHVLSAALAAKTPKVVYISTIGAFGNTEGEVVDESYVHPEKGFSSYYEETKVEAHKVAKRLIAEQDLPCVIVQPGGVYGPGDHSAVGHQISEFLRGRMPLLIFPDLGFNLVHVDDVAAGVVLALDAGQAGQSYVLGGEITTMRGLITKLAEVAGRKAPTRAIPTGLLKAIAPAGPLVGKLMGQPPNMHELISSADGVTYWASDDKARAELGYSPRDLSSGLREMLLAEGKLS